ncbi:hypothetical protein GCM10027053_51490 [Intrasporangium mesophilum]
MSDFPDHPLYYGLDGQPIEREEAWRLMADGDARRVAWTDIGDWWVSTVFLVLDHSFGMGPPMLWESMAFVEGRSDMLGPVRYPTREAALAGHDQMVAEVRSMLAEVDRLTEGPVWDSSP